MSREDNGGDTAPVLDPLHFSCQFLNDLELKLFPLEEECHFNIVVPEDDEDDTYAAMIAALSTALSKERVHLKVMSTGKICALKRELGEKCAGKLAFAEAQRPRCLRWTEDEMPTCLSHRSLELMEFLTALKQEQAKATKTMAWVEHALRLAKTVMTPSSFSALKEHTANLLSLERDKPFQDSLEGLTVASITDELFGQLQAPPPESVLLGALNLFKEKCIPSTLMVYVETVDGGKVREEIRMHQEVHYSKPRLIVVPVFHGQLFVIVGDMQKDVRCVTTSTIPLPDSVRQLGRLLTEQMRPEADVKLPEKPREIRLTRQQPAVFDHTIVVLNGIERMCTPKPHIQWQANTAAAHRLLLGAQLAMHKLNTYAPLSSTGSSPCDFAATPSPSMAPGTSFFAQDEGDGAGEAAQPPTSRHARARQTVPHEDAEEDEEEGEGLRALTGPQREALNATAVDGRHTTHHASNDVHILSDSDEHAELDESDAPTSAAGVATIPAGKSTARRSTRRGTEQTNSPQRARGRVRTRAGTKRAIAAAKGRADAVATETTASSEATTTAATQEAIPVPRAAAIAATTSPARATANPTAPTSSAAARGPLELGDMFPAALEDMHSRSSTASHQHAPAKAQQHNVVQPIQRNPGAGVRHQHHETGHELERASTTSGQAPPVLGLPRDNSAPLVDSFMQSALGTDAHSFSAMFEATTRMATTASATAGNVSMSQTNAAQAPRLPNVSDAIGPSTAQRHSVDDNHNHNHNHHQHNQPRQRHQHQQLTRDMRQFIMDAEKEGLLSSAFDLPCSLITDSSTDGADHGTQRAREVGTSAGAAGNITDTSQAAAVARLLHRPCSALHRLVEFSHLESAKPQDIAAFAQRSLGVDLSLAEARLVCCGFLRAIRDGGRHTHLLSDSASSPPLPLSPQQSRSPAKHTLADVSGEETQRAALALAQREHRGLVCSTRVRLQCLRRLDQALQPLVAAVDEMETGDGQLRALHTKLRAAIEKIVWKMQGHGHATNRFSMDQTGTRLTSDGAVGNAGQTSMAASLLGPAPATLLSARADAGTLCSLDATTHAAASIGGSPARRVRPSPVPLQTATEGCGARSLTDMSSSTDALGVRRSDFGIAVVRESNDGSGGDSGSSSGVEQGDNPVDTAAGQHGDYQQSTVPHSETWGRQGALDTVTEGLQTTPGFVSEFMQTACGEDVAAVGDSTAPFTLEGYDQHHQQQQGFPLDAFHQASPLQAGGELLGMDASSTDRIKREEKTERRRRRRKKSNQARTSAQAPPPNVPSASFGGRGVRDRFVFNGMQDVAQVFLQCQAQTRELPQLPRAEEGKGGGDGAANRDGERPQRKRAKRNNNRKRDVTSAKAAGAAKRATNMRPEDCIVQWRVKWKPQDKRGGNRSKRRSRGDKAQNNASASYSNGGQRGPAVTGASNSS